MGSTLASALRTPGSRDAGTCRYAIEQVIRDIGGLRLAAVDRPTARAWANEWPRNTTRTVRTMWADALRDGICQHNPFTNLRLETPRGRTDLIALSEREKAPKNGLARPMILPPRALEALSMVARRTDSPNVFHSPRGKRLNKGSLNYLWRPVAAAWRAQGGRDVDLYGLRHACATLLLERGLAPADVAVQLGHTDGGRLVQILYGHPDEDRALDRLQMAFAGDGHKPTLDPGRLGHDPATGV